MHAYWAQWNREELEEMFGIEENTNHFEDYEAAEFDEDIETSVQRRNEEILSRFWI